MQSIDMPALRDAMQRASHLARTATTAEQFDEAADLAHATQQGWAEAAEVCEEAGRGAESFMARVNAAVCRTLGWFCRGEAEARRVGVEAYSDRAEAREGAEQ